MLSIVRRPLRVTIMMRNLLMGEEGIALNGDGPVESRSARAHFHEVHAVEWVPFRMGGSTGT